MRATAEDGMAAKLGVFDPSLRKAMNVSSSAFRTVASATRFADCGDEGVVADGAAVAVGTDTGALCAAMGFAASVQPAHPMIRKAADSAQPLIRAETLTLLTIDPPSEASQPLFAGDDTEPTGLSARGAVPGATTWVAIAFSRPATEIAPLRKLRRPGRVAGGCGGFCCRRG
jgi:hypothetical protein